MKTLNKQNGATLFIGLMYLIMLGLMINGLSGSSNMEEKMTGNARNRDLAYQSAEAGLKYVENNLTTGVGIVNLFSGFVPAGYNNSGVTVTSHSELREINSCLPNTANYWNGTGDKDCNGATQSYDWSTAVLSGNNVAAVGAQAKYVVDRLPDDGTSKRFRVTVKGTGGDSNAAVILQALYIVS